MWNAEKFYCVKCHTENFIDSGVSDIVTRGTFCYTCFHERYPSAPIFYYDLLGADISCSKNVDLQHRPVDNKELHKSHKGTPIARPAFKKAIPIASQKVLKRLSEYNSKVGHGVNKPINDDSTVAPLSAQPAEVQQLNKVEETSDKNRKATEIKIDEMPSETGVVAEPLGTNANSLLSNDGFQKEKISNYSAPMRAESITVLPADMNSGDLPSNKSVKASVAVMPCFRHVDKYPRTRQKIFAPSHERKHPDIFC